MKKLLFLSFATMLIISSCQNNGNGQLTGVQNRERFSQPDPYEMAYVPMGSYVMGAGDQDITYAQLNAPRTITISAFWMDEAEITNNKYRQFVYWVRDSIARRLAGDIRPDDFLVSENTKTGETFDPPYLNWETKLNWKDPDLIETLDQMYVPEHERYFRKKDIDARKLFYEYYYVDLQEAAKKDGEGGQHDSKNAAFANRTQGLKDRSVFVHKETINVYPDTLCWISDYAYSYNEPKAKEYFSHPAFDHYPVVGVNWRQANAFCIWRTRLLEGAKTKRKTAEPSEFRLPTEAEWEWAARGGNSRSPYPWGGPYTTNDRGCYLANFKPLRGDYAADGGAFPLVVGHYPANDFGLYDMAGNVSEWCRDAYDESVSSYAWDMNPSYIYNAKDDDPISLKRKVIRGGSWKDISYYCQVTTRHYEYQDTAKCYIGFRCVQDFMGRQRNDNPSKASRIYN